MQLVVDCEWKYLKVKGDTLEKKYFMELVHREPLYFHFIRSSWDLDKSVSPKQSLLHRVEINHLPGVCERFKMNKTALTLGALTRKCQREVQK